ncbi:MAG: LysE family transporter [Planctomycetes bacterium]|nr:LysE family transporter [Planctomycetota bacterium]
MPFLIKGLLLGFSVAAPVGPIGLLCIQRTLEFGFLSGLLTGIGAAVADSVYGCVAAFGLSAISDLLKSLDIYLKFIGGAVLCYLGISSIIRKKISQNHNVDRKKSCLSSFVSSLGLTLSNPATIFSFMAIYSGLGVGQTSGDYLSASIIVLGVFLGSAIWWLFLSCITFFIRNRMGSTLIAWINRISGAAIFGFGIYIFLG